MRCLAQKQNGSSFDTADWAEVKDGDRIVVTYWALLTKDAFLFDDGNEDEAVSYDADGKTTVKTNGPTTPSVVATGPDRVDSEQVLENRDADDRSADSAVLACGAKPFTRRGDARPTTHRLYMAKAREENKDSAGANSYTPLGGAKLSMCKATTQEHGQPTDVQKASSAPLASGAETQYYKINALSYPNDGMTDTDLLRHVQRGLVPRRRHGPRRRAGRRLRHPRHEPTRRRARDRQGWRRAPRDRRHRHRDLLRLGRGSHARGQAPHWRGGLRPRA